MVNDFRSELRLKSKYSPSAVVNIVAVVVEDLKLKTPMPYTHIFNPKVAIQHALSIEYVFSYILRN